MKIIQNRKNIVLMVGIAVIAVSIFVSIFMHVLGLNRAKFSGADDDVSYNKSAWKFADLVQDNVLYPVVRDIDGDTIIVNISGHQVTVRLIGADTPETVDPRKSVQCYGPEASAEAKRIFGINKNYASTTDISVYLEKDPLKGDYDKYGRLLAYVRLPEDISPAEGENDVDIPSTDIYNEYMITHGFAHEYTFLNQPYKYQTQFKADELSAQNARRGLWGKCPDADKGD